MKKIIIIISFFILLSSCYKEEIKQNENKTISWSVQTWSILEETNNSKIIDLTEKTKSELICNFDDSGSEVCDLYLDFWTYWKFKIYTYFEWSFSWWFDKSIFETWFWWKAYFNEKYNSIFVSFWITWVWSNIITNSLKIDLSTKKLINFESTLWNEFYFKDIDTIIPKFIYTSDTSYEEIIEEWKSVILWENNNSTKEDLQWIDFVKNYYEVMWKKDFNELANITEWNTFEQLKDWYKNLEKVEVIDIKDLWNNKYKVVVDLYEKLVNLNWSITWKSHTQYIEDQYLYSRIIIEKEIINWKLKTIKWTNKTINLPRVKIDFSWEWDYSFDWYNSKIYEKKLQNWKIFQISRSIHDWWTLGIYLYNWKKYIMWNISIGDFSWFFWIKNWEGTWSDLQEKELIKFFKQSSDDMFEKVLFQ